MEVYVTREIGYFDALIGLGLSYGLTSDYNFYIHNMNTTDYERLENIASNLYFKDNGHNKFLESICVWIDIKAPRFWWQEFDTYRIGVTKQSECFSEDTEVLTNMGWYKFAKVPNEAKYATLNIETEIIEYQSAINTISDYYDGKMFHFNTAKIDLLVTPNHNILLSSNLQNPKFEFIKASEINCDRFIIPKQGVISGGDNPTNYTIPAIETTWDTGCRVCNIKWKEKNIPIKDWLWFLGFWIADGSVHKNNRNYNTMIFQNSNQPFVQKIDKIVKMLGYKYYRKEIFRPKSNNTYITWIISNKQLYEHLFPIGNTYTKHIPEYVFNLSKDLQYEFWDGLFSGDGTITSGVYSTASKQLADDVQRLLRNIGISSNVYFRRNTNSRIGGTYTINTQLTKNYHIRRESINLIDYTGMIHCVEVPNNTLYTRRNGKAIWSGNSTIHTITHRSLTQNDFEYDLPEETLNRLNQYIETKDFVSLKNELPEGFLQRRIVCTNYKVLRHIIKQRKKHKLIQWKFFIDQIVEQCELKFFNDLVNLN